MKKYLNYALGYAVAAMAGGVFYREFTKFNGFTGTVKEVNNERKKIVVEVKIFGRGNDLTLEVSQVEKV